MSHHFLEYNNTYCAVQDSTWLTLVMLAKSEVKVNPQINFQMSVGNDKRAEG